MKRVSINPITRLEGHGKIEIFLDADGNVANAYFQVPELRGFEQFCVGRAAEDMPAIMSRICGVCPEAHHLAATKALDQLFAVDPPAAAQKIRELLYMAFFITDHTTHFYALGGPDFIIGPDAPPQERNILGVIRKVGLDVGKQVLSCRARNHHVIQMLGGRGVHPAGGLPGGWSKSISEQERSELAQIAAENVEFARFTLRIFDSIVLQNGAYSDLIQSDVYHHETYYMGTVDEKNRANFYDGTIRVVDPEGSEALRFSPTEYAQHLGEHVEPWTYLKFPFLKKIGWKGFVDGINSGVYCATPLSRLNVSDGLSTPLAHAEFERFFAAFQRKKLGGRYQPVHHRMATHWARLIELLHAAERMQELVRDPEITSSEVRRIPTRIAGVGIGSIEAPRGTLFHHYEADERGILTRVNLLVGTTNNHAAISLSIKRAAEKLIHGGKVVEEGLLNRIEMAFRLYDPCLSCATHALPGSMPLIVDVFHRDGHLIRSIRREG
jgi:F420-non-reducing hydrogenase large subunit